MKLWELASVLRQDGTGHAIEIASANAQWADFANWLLEFSKLVAAQDREKLDFELPDDFAIEALRSSNFRFFICQDGWIRSRRLSSKDKELSAIEAFELCGGHALEEALEYGSFKF